ncbi:hypothetical protein CLIM01_02778 [Colletotrichum limetticola]|uniref:DUF5071 domain-containing protein n=1 Tax=Colletotrichum limetticola TaxID=1209924 RepID=A0ABQ9Q801_9PEZI|nr:hypothetical protein CLIM01_02778 [Colletotrichum limetticola]
MNHRHQAASSLIPEDHTNTSTISTIESLEPDAFASLIPSLLALRPSSPRSNCTESSFVDLAQDIVLRRAGEAAAAAVLSKYLQPPFEDQDAVDNANLIVDIIMKLSFDDMQLYRPAMETIATSDRVAADHLQRPLFLEDDAKSILRFANDRNAIWVHTYKFDVMAARTLRERIKTPEQLQPLVPGLLDWLADINWPPFKACCDALAVFPEVTVMPIRNLLSSARGDGGWLTYVLQYITHWVPVGELWEEFKPQVQALMNDAKGDEEEWELADTAREWLNMLDEHWEKEKLRQ